MGTSSKLEKKHAHHHQQRLFIANVNALYLLVARERLVNMVSEDLLETREILVKLVKTVRMVNKVKMVFKDQREKKDPMEVPVLMVLLVNLVLMVNPDIMVTEVTKVHREKKVSKDPQDNQDLLDLTVNEVILDQKVESVISVCPV